MFFRSHSSVPSRSIVTRVVAVAAAVVLIILIDTFFPRIEYGFNPIPQKEISGNLHTMDHFDYAVQIITHVEFHRIPKNHF
mmetsp:Transcript_41785/g.47261  ORF Transcript_41785/g.47261 Transcript_41785/m.47261 type:complete len:81 (+) Transcript_41785:134-376(+)